MHTIKNLPTVDTVFKQVGTLCAQSGGGGKQIWFGLLPKKAGGNTADLKFDARNTLCYNINWVRSQPAQAVYSLLMHRWIQLKYKSSQEN